MNEVYFLLFLIVLACLLKGIKYLNKKSLPETLKFLNGNIIHSNGTNFEMKHTPRWYSWNIAKVCVKHQSIEIKHGLKLKIVSLEKNIILL